MKEKILKLLEHDAKIKPEQIAALLALPEEEVKRQISELEESKTIVQYKTIIDWEKVAGGDMVYAFIEVKVTPERDLGFDAVAKRIYRFPEVHSLYLISGDYDLAVVVEGKTMKEVAYFVAEKLATLEHVQSTATHFVLKKYKVDGEILGEVEKVKRLPVTP
ncbi:MAG: Lrp/AsnC family transcriptional regulator [bacterium]|nr:Lrp/AsnC family transcriptional regulator [bacterium]